MVRLPIAAATGPEAPCINLVIIFTTSILLEIVHSTVGKVKRIIDSVSIVIVFFLIHF
jgi:hypothetical protein